MDCRAFENRLESFLAAALAPAEADACRRHAAACPACGELLELARLGGAPEVDGPPETLVEAVLSRTSGSACATARQRLVALPEGATPADRELLDLHLAACADCRATARVLAALAHDLPRLAEVRPDPGFTEAVLAASGTPWRRWRRAAASWSGSWSRRWAAWVRRPRFAWEAAFVLTLVLLPAFASPASPLATVPESAREIVRRNPVERVEDAADDLGRRLDGAVAAAGWRRAVRETVRGLVVARATVADLAGRAETLLQARARSAGDGLGTLRDRAASFLVRGAEAEPSAETTNPTPPDAASDAPGRYEETR